MTTLPAARARFHPVLRAAIPWVAVASLVALTQWLTLPLAAWRFGARTAWWLPLAAGALLRQSVVPLVRARMAQSVRPRVLAWVASRALASGAFEAEPSSLAPISQRVEHALEHSLPTLAGAALATAAFALLTAREFPWWWSPAMVAACAGALGVRVAARRALDGSADALLDALRAEGQWLHAAARGRWEITGEARARFAAGAGDRSRAVVSAEHTHQARTRVVRSAQVALFLAPLAAVLLGRARHGTPVSLRDWVLVLPALAPALAVLRSVDELAMARRALARGDSSREPSDEASGLPAPPAPEGELVVDAVTVRYGDAVALAAVSLTVPARGVLAVVGPNGAGKSTLARVLAGAVIPDAGSCSVAGVAMSALPAESIAFVPQHPCLIEDATVIANLRLVAPDASDTAARETLKSLGLDVSLDHLVARLSRGEQRRVAIARALLKDPRWLVLDEPDAWLDDAGREALQTVLRARGERAAVVLVTHRADLVDWADRVAVLSREHTLEAVGPPRETLTSSRTGRALLAGIADESLRFGSV